LGSKNKTVVDYHRDKRYNLHQIKRSIQQPPWWLVTQNQRSRRSDDEIRNGFEANKHNRSKVLKVYFHPV
jgi:hypothetical protein